MPTYQYVCTACDHEFEAVQSFSDNALTTCPTCEGRLRKVFSAVGVVFKGSGFYRTDSRSATAAKTSADSGSGEPGSKPGDAGGKKDGSSTESVKANTAPTGATTQKAASSTAGHAA